MMTILFFKNTIVSENFISELKVLILMKICVEYYMYNIIVFKIL